MVGSPQGAARRVRHRGGRLQQQRRRHDRREGRRGGHVPRDRLERDVPGDRHAGRLERKARRRHVRIPGRPLRRSAHRRAPLHAPAAGGPVDHAARRDGVRPELSPGERHARLGRGHQRGLPLGQRVHAPGGAPGPLPVMVFIYGGAFTSGSSSLYDGQAMSEKGPVVVVTMNYRLGALGFLALPELDGTRPGAPSGSDGIRDQQLALKWVHDNVATFHGDANNVTVFGESAGSMSTCIHLVSPGSQGLANRYIMESGACVGKSTLLATEAQAYRIGQELASSILLDRRRRGPVRRGLVRRGGVRRGPVRRGPVQREPRRRAGVLASRRPHAAHDLGPVRQRSADGHQRARREPARPTVHADDRGPGRGPSRSAREPHRQGQLQQGRGDSRGHQQERVGTVRRAGHEPPHGRVQPPRRSTSRAPRSSTRASRRSSARRAPARSRRSTPPPTPRLRRCSSIW